jgi:hypothetical protein
VHRTPLPAEDRTRRGALPVTTPARTWRDLAGVLTLSALLAVTDQFLARGVTRAELSRQLQGRPTGRGSARAREVLPIADPRTESPMESVLRWLVHAAGLPAPELQYVVRDGAGLVLGRADLAWPDRRMLVEFDGDVHRERDVFVNDLRRQNRLVAAGRTVLRFSSADVWADQQRSSGRSAAPSADEIGGLPRFEARIRARSPISPGSAVTQPMPRARAASTTRSTTVCSGSAVLSMTRW